MIKKVLYAGSFDPITNGHLDLIKRAARLGERLIVGVIQNPSKTPFFTVEERLEMIKAATSTIPNVKLIILQDFLRNMSSKITSTSSSGDCAYRWISNTRSRWRR